MTNITSTTQTRTGLERAPAPRRGPRAWPRAPWSTESPLPGARHAAVPGRPRDRSETARALPSRGLDPESCSPVRSRQGGGRERSRPALESRTMEAARERRNVRSRVAVGPRSGVGRTTLVISSAKTHCSMAPPTHRAKRRETAGPRETERQRQRPTRSRENITCNTHVPVYTGSALDPHPPSSPERGGSDRRDRERRRKSAWKPELRSREPDPGSEPYI